MKSMILLEMKCPQLSKPEATAARNPNSVIGGLGHRLYTAERWWARLWVRSGAGEMVNGDPQFARSRLHEAGEVLSPDHFLDNSVLHAVFKLAS